MIVMKNGEAVADKHIDAPWRDFIATRSLTPEQVRIAKEAMDRLCARYPAFLNDQSNQDTRY